MCKTVVEHDIGPLLASRRKGPSGPLDCRLWTGAVSDRGYPVACVKGTNRQVRRIVYERERRKLQDGERVKMQCGERLCLEPGHMIATPRYAP